MVVNNGSAYNDFYARLMRHPFLILVFLLITAIVFGSKIPQLQLDASGDSLVLEGDKSLETYRKVYKEYGATEFLVVTYQPKEDLFSASTIQHVAALKADLQKLPGVSSVVTYLDVPLLYSPRVTLSNFNEGVHYLNDGTVDKQLARQEFLQSPIYSELITSKKQTTTAIQINLLADEKLRDLRIKRDDLKAVKDRSAEQDHELDLLEKTYDKERVERNRLEKKLVIDVRAVLQLYRHHAQIFLGGLPMILSDMLDYVQSDMAVFGTAIGLFIILTLILIFRSPRWVVLPLATCGLTCIYMLGGVAWLGVKLTVISANFIALLLIIALSITIHIVVSFIESEKEEPDMDQFQLVMKTVHHMFKPCVYTTLTTMVAFLSLVLSGIRPVIDFGWMMTIAVGLSLVIGFFLLPAGLLLLPREFIGNDDKLTRNVTSIFARFTHLHGKLLMLISAMIFVFSIWGIFQLKVENRFIDYFDESTEIYQGMLQIDAELGGTLPLDIVIYHKPVAPAPKIVKAAEVVDDDFDDVFAEDEGDDFASGQSTPYAMSYWFSRRGMQEIKKVHDYIDKIDSTGKVLSLATLYSVLNDVTEGAVDDVQLALIKKNLSNDIDSVLVKPYLSADGSQTRITVRVKETSKSLNRSQMIKDINHFMTSEMGYKKEDYELTGMMVMYNNMLQSLFSSQIVSLGAVFIAIMLMFVVLFRSVKVSVIAITPNILAALFVLGCMGWFGIPLDMMSIMIAGITVGIGVDDTIHYIHRFEKEFLKDRDYIATMYRCHASIGMAMVYTSVVIIAGFSILTLSNFTPSIYFGLLTGLAMFAALLGALSLLPQLLILIKPFGK